MKKILSYILIAIISFSFVGCGAKKENNDKISVAATTFSSYDFTRQIAGGKVELSMLLPPGSESHSFEPTPQDIIKIQNSDIFIYVGGENDAWVDTILDGIDTSKTKVITLLDCVKPVEEEVVEGMQEEEEEASEEEGPEYDEHVWTSPANAKLIVEKISVSLQNADSKNADTYKKNTANYLKKLDELDTSFKDVVSNAKRKTIIFGDRFPFRYFADAYGLKYYAAFPGCSTDTEASAKTVKFLIDKVKSEKIPVVFHIELSNKKMANSISEQTGAKVLELHAAHNISKIDFENGVTYLDIMNKNVTALKEALK